MAETPPVISYADPFLQAGGSITEQDGELMIRLPVRNGRFPRIARVFVTTFLAFFFFFGCLRPLWVAGTTSWLDFAMLAICSALVGAIEIHVRQRQRRPFNPWARLKQMSAQPTLRFTSTTVVYDGPVLNGNQNLPNETLEYPLALVREIRTHRFSPGILVFIRGRNILHLPDCGSPEANQRLIDEVVSWCARHNVHVDTAD
jgi:hypothetical protein